MTFAIMVAMGKFGIEITLLIAGISVIGFGTSFALQGPLSNYAAGISLIFTKPFKVGNIVEVAGEMGEIIDIKLPRTEMKNVDGSLVIIPNNKIIGEVIQNFANLKRLHLTIGINYDSDMDDVLRIIKDVVAKEKLVNEKEPKIGISKFADSSVNIMLRLFCPQDEYWNTQFRLNKAIWDALKENNIDTHGQARGVLPFGFSYAGAPFMASYEYRKVRSSAQLRFAVNSLLHLTLLSQP